MRVVLSRAAAADLESIDAYALEHFGLDRAIQTASRFRETLATLAKMPRLGTLRPEIGPPGVAFRCFPVLGLFIVVYEASEDTVRVVRIIHGARNLPAELERDLGDTT